MYLQGEEVKRLQGQINILQEKKARSQASHLVEVQESQRLAQRLQQLEKKYSIGHTLGQAKDRIGIDIHNYMNGIQPSIHIIFQQNELIQKSKEAIEEIQKQLGDNPNDATDLITFLNSKNKYELEELGLEDTIETILEVKKVLTKSNLLLQLEEKCQSLKIGVHRFLSKFEVLSKKGLRSLYVLNDKLITLDDYNKNLVDTARDKSKFASIKGKITSKAFLETLENDLNIQHEVIHFFIIKPTFTKYTKVDQVYRRLLKMSIPKQERWEKLCELLE